MEEDVYFSTVVKSDWPDPLMYIQLLQSDMDLWKLWPTNQTKERILMSDEQEEPNKLTEAQKEMMRNVREMDKKQKDFDSVDLKTTDSQK